MRANIKTNIQNMRTLSSYPKIVKGKKSIFILMLKELINRPNLNFRKLDSLNCRDRLKIDTNILLFITGNSTAHFVIHFGNLKYLYFHQDTTIQKSIQTRLQERKLTIE